MDQQVPEENPTADNLPPTEPTAASEQESSAAGEPSVPSSASKREEGIGKIDLSALAGFSFGTQWTRANAGPAREERSERPDRPDRRGGQGGGQDRGEFKRDRRPAARPTGQSSPQGREAAPYQAGEPRQERPDRGGNARPDRAGNARPERAAGPQGGYRSEQGGYRGEQGGYRSERGPGGPGGYGSRERRPERGAPQEMRVPFNPNFEVAFYPEDTAFTALVKAIRASCHTYELFEIARVVLGKNDRFVVVVQRKPDSQGQRSPLYVTPVDGLPFVNEDEAVQHVLRNHMGEFFTMAEVEVEAPKGNFQYVMRCGMTGELLGPPNYHRYQNILQQHHATRLAEVPFERFRERLETVREAEVIAQWAEKMKKTTRYVWKGQSESAPTFDTLEEARTYLLANARDRVVRAYESARFQGKVADQLPAGELRDAAEGLLDRQRRFPLDTANALRGRLRREGFTIFKRGSKGVSYVCAVKRKFRLPGQVFSESITALINFIEKNPLASVKEIPAKHLGLASAESGATPESDAVLKRLWMDLRWLVAEGYVTEYSDGKLFAAPPLTAQQQKSEEAANAAADAAEDAARAAAGDSGGEVAEPSGAAEPSAEPPMEPAGENVSGS
jgi:hypothetical protein